MNHVGTSVNLHVVKGGRVLLLRRASTRWLGSGLQIPGGKVDPGESPLAAVLREAGEELGLQIGPTDVRYRATVAVRQADGAEYYAIQFELVRPGDYEYRIMEPEKCSELVWAPVTGVPDDTIDLFKTILARVAAGETYIEIGY